MIMLKRFAIGWPLLAVSLMATAILTSWAPGQPQPPGGGFQPFDKFDKGGRGKGGPGGPGGQQVKLVKQFDKNGDGWLNKEEREAARAFLKTNGGGRRGGRGPGGRGGGEAGKPG